MVVGAIYKQDANFDQFREISGVMGFTGTGDRNVLAQLVKGGLCDNDWAVCMHERGRSNGTLTIGGVDPQLSAKGEMAYVPDVGGGEFWAVAAESLQLDNETAFSLFSMFDGGRAILDICTNVLLLPTKAMSAVKRRMCADATHRPSCVELWSGDCVALTETAVAAFPDLSINLKGGVTLVMRSTDYLLQGSPLAATQGQYCLAIRDGGSAGGTGFIIGQTVGVCVCVCARARVFGFSKSGISARLTVLGETTMRNYYVVFDKGSQRVGWGQVDRNNCGNL